MNKAKDNQDRFCGLSKITTGRKGVQPGRSMLTYIQKCASCLKVCHIASSDADCPIRDEDGMGVCSRMRR